MSPYRYRKPEVSVANWALYGAAWGFVLGLCATLIFDSPTPLLRLAFEGAVVGLGASFMIAMIRTRKMFKIKASTR